MKILDGSGDVVTVAFCGKLDMEGVKAIEESFKELTLAKSAIVDMTNLEYLASMGIRVILQSAKAAAKNGKKMIILNPRKNVLGVLQLANLDSVIPVIFERDEAARYL